MIARKTLLIAAIALLPTAALAQTAATPTAAPAQSAPAAPVATDPAKAAPEADKARSDAAAKYREACGADVQKFCSTIERSKETRGQMRACLDANAKDLSSTCNAARAERAAQPRNKS